MPTRNLKLGTGDAALIVCQDLSIEGNIPKQKKDEKILLNSMLIMSIVTRLRKQPEFAQECIDWMEQEMGREKSRIILAPKKELIRGH